MIILLAIFAVILEALQVAYTISVSRGKKTFAALSSGMIELVKMASIVLVIESTNRIANVIIIAIVCSLGTYFTMAIIGKDYHD